MRKPLFITLGAVLLGSGLAFAAEDTSLEDKLREGLRNTMLQLREAQNQNAILQSTQVASEQKIKQLESKVETLTRQAVEERNATTNQISEMGAQLEEQKMLLLELQASLEKWKRSYSEVTLIAQKKERERLKANAQIATLDRKLADQQLKNIQMYKVGLEILDRYEKFGLGEAVLAREPFVRTTKVKFQNLMQDYQDQLVDQRIKP